MKLVLNSLVVILLLTACFNGSRLEQEPVTKEVDVKAILLMLDSSGVDTSNYDQLFQIAYEGIYYGKNEKGNALMRYSMAHIDSLTAEDYHAWSVQNTKNGTYDIAVQALDSAYAMDPRDISAYYGWVTLYYYRDYEKALKLLEEVDGYTPNFSDAPMGEDVHYLKGLAHMGLKNWDKAIVEFDQYIQHLESTHGEEFIDVYAFVQKGRALTQQKRYPEAIQSYKRAVKNYKYCSEAYFFMSDAQRALNQLDSACVSLHKAYDLIQKGYKSSDNYVEYFHEIYPQQVKAKIERNCNH